MLTNRLTNRDIQVSITDGGVNVLYTINVPKSTTANMTSLPKDGQTLVVTTKTTVPGAADYTLTFQTPIFTTFPVVIGSNNNVFGVVGYTFFESALTNMSLEVNSIIETDPALPSGTLATFSGSSNVTVYASDSVPDVVNVSINAAGKISNTLVEPSGVVLLDAPDKSVATLTCGGATFRFNLAVPTYAQVNIPSIDFVNGVAVTPYLYGSFVYPWLALIVTPAPWAPPAVARPPLGTFTTAGAGILAGVTVVAAVFIIALSVAVAARKNGPITVSAPVNQQ